MNRAAPLLVPRINLENAPPDVGEAAVARLNRDPGSPAFEADVAEDDTIRRLLLKVRFVTQEANRAAAGGITGGTIEYRLQYADVGADVTIPPVRGARPIEEFNAALQRELAR